MACYLASRRPPSTRRRGVVSLGQLRVSTECRDTLQIAAGMRGISVYQLQVEILEEWAKRVDR